MRRNNKSWLHLPQGRGPCKSLGGATVMVALLGAAFTASAITAAHSGDRTRLTATASAGLYTRQQAEAGRQVYSQNCAECHGDHEQGASAPPIAGGAFLKKAKLLGWTVENLRQIVLTTMPRSNPGSLSSQQYADVLAYLLASDCLPAGNSAFPTKTTPALTKTPLQKPQDTTPDNQNLGICSVHGKA
jgi:polar amino acid transport system substrate-binding protein